MKNIYYKTLLSLIFIIIITCIINIIFKKTNAVEGFDIPKGFRNMFETIFVTNPEIVGNNLRDNFSHVGDGLKSDFNNIGTYADTTFWNTIGFFKTNAEATYSYLECGGIRIENFGNCFIYYIFDIIMDIIYWPFEFIFWFLGMPFVLDTFFQFRDALDCQVNSILGFYLFRHSDSVRQMCYICNFKDFNTEFKNPEVGGWVNPFDGFLTNPDIFDGILDPKCAWEGDQNC